MCGFLGIYSKKEEGTSYSDMSPLLGHRGPDQNIKILLDEGRVSFEFFRLAIIDLESGGQPSYCDQRKIVSVFNGEIYNYKELRSLIQGKGYTLKTHGDAEVIPFLYKIYGENFVTHLRGMFTILLWDGDQLQVYRDRFGIKPLYTYEDNERVIYCSEIKPILKLTGNKELDPHGIQNYFQYGYVLAPNTVYKNIKSIPPATHVKHSRKGPTKQRFYWDINPKDLSSWSRDQMSEAIVDKFQESVGLHLRADVKQGIFLSGGFDSGFLLAHAAKLQKNISSFTLSFKESDYDEGPIAREIAQMHGSDHQIFQVDEDDLLSLLPFSIWHTELPFADSGVLANFLISKKAQETGHKVVLCGAGGDELFGGYPYHVRSPIERKLQRVGLLAKVFGKTIGGELGRKLLRSTHYDSNPLSHYVGHTRVFHDLSFLGHSTFEDQKSSWFNNYSGECSFDARLYTDLHTYIPDDLMLLLDRATMAWSIEGRIPFLDHEFVELVLGVPRNIKVPGGERKGFFKEICRSYLPQSVYDLPKLGFNSPVHKWMNGKLGKISDQVLTSERFLERNFYDREKLRKLTNSQNLNSHQKWTLLSMELFCRIHVDQETPEKPFATLGDLV